MLLGKWSDFRFASYYNDHMVLQQAPKKATVWGYADIKHLGSKVKVSVLSRGKTFVKKYQTEIKKGII